MLVSLIYISIYLPIVTDGIEENTQQIDELCTNKPKFELRQYEDPWAIVKPAFYEAVNLTISRGININLNGSGGKTLLFFAAEMGDLKTVKLLVDHGADVNATDINGQTPLHVAVSHGNTNIARYLCKEKAGVNLKDVTGRSPLYSAMETGNVECGKILVEMGADIKTETSLYRKLTHAAAERGHEKAMYWLLATTPIVNISKGRKKMNYLEHDVLFKTPLWYAATLNNIDIVKLIVPLLARIPSEPLWSAINMGNFAVTKYLIESGGDVNARPRDSIWSGRTLLIRSIERNHLGIVRLLLNYKADVNLKTKENYTALHAAVSANNKLVTEWLLSKGAYVNAENYNGYTPLDYATNEKILGTKKDPEIARLLLRRGAKTKTEIAKSRLPPSPPLPPIPTVKPVSNLTENKNSDNIGRKNVENQENETEVLGETQNTFDQNKTSTNIIDDNNKDILENNCSNKSAGIEEIEGKVKADTKHEGNETTNSLITLKFEENDKTQNGNETSTILSSN